MTGSRLVRGVEESGRIHGPLACVLGDLDLVRPLGLAGIRSAVVAGPDHPATFSRFVDRVIPAEYHEFGDERLAERLVRFARTQPEPPVLFYQRDGHALFVSRYRELLATAFRFVIAAPGQVEELLDKSRFAETAEALGLPIPRTVVLDTAGEVPEGLPYPLVVKPPTRGGDGRWAALGQRGKAMRIESRDALLRFWPDFRRLPSALVAQELVEGPECRIESYHAYVDAQGNPVGEFTGRKLRTTPTEYGFTTSAVITEAPDVLDLGRRTLRALDVTGVAKVDLKRAPDGGLRLLEVNPRFNLWHHPGAVAGVNLPALVWADLTGRPRPTVQRPRPGVRWCSAKDRHPAADDGLSRAAWVRWALRCEAKANFAWDDPGLVVKRAWRSGRRRAGV